MEIRHATPGTPRDIYADALREAMTERGWTQERLATELEAAGWRVARSTISHWAVARYLPAPVWARRVERVLGVPARLAYPELWGEDSGTPSITIHQSGG